MSASLADAAPANDNFANAISLGGLETIDFPLETSGDNIDATMQGGEPNPLFGDHSVWWSFTALDTGVIEINTEGSDFDTILYVFSGASLGTLVAKGTNDDGNDAPTSTVVFFAAAGTTYRIAVLGYSETPGIGEQGDITLTILEGPPPPTNDNFSSRVELTGMALPITVTPPTTGTNLGATMENPLKEDPLGIGGASVWWKWSPPSTGWYEVHTLNSDFDTVLYIFTGTILPVLTAVESNDNDTGFDLQSRVKVYATAGTQYQIAVHGYQAATGSVVLRINSTSAPPANDDFANATVMAGVSPTSSSGNTTGATLEGPEQDSLFIGGASIWFRWTSSVTGWVNVNTFGSAVDTALYVFEEDVTPGLANLIELGANDDSEGVPQSGINFSAVMGETYYFAVHGFDGAGGAISIHVGPGIPPPGNDDFADAVDLGTGLPATPVSGASTAGASLQAGEPRPLGKGGASVWYCWTAPLAGGRFSVDTAGSTFDTILYVFEEGASPDLADLVPVGFDNDHGGTLQSRVNFDAAGGEKYYIAVHGRRGATGSINLAIAAGDPVVANDNFDDAEDLGDFATASVTGFSTVGASIEIDEPDSLGVGGSSVWYVWTPPGGSGTARYKLDTTGSSFATTLYVFRDTNGTIEGLEPVAFNTSSGGTTFAALNFDADEGEIYYFAVHGDRGLTGTLNLTLGAGIAAPANDAFAGVINLGTGGPAGVTGISNAGASLEMDEQNLLGSGEASLWYCWTAPGGGGWFQFDTLLSDYNTMLYIFTEGATPALKDLQAVATNDDHAAGNSQSVIKLNTTPNQKYYISALGFFGATGLLDLKINATTAPPANDNFSGAIDLTAQLPLPINVAAASTVGATIEGAEDDSLNLGGASVWFRLTPNFSGWVDFDTFGSDYDTALYLFEDTNEAIDGLLEVDNNDDEDGDAAQSRLNFDVSSGTTYYLSVHGFLGVTGNLALNLTSVTTPPANDDFANAEHLGAVTSGSFSRDNIGATIQGREPDPLDDAGDSVWFSWTPPAGAYSVDTLGSSFDTVLYVFRENPVSPGLLNLILIGASDAAAGTPQSRVNFNADGLKYYIAVHGDDGGTGNITLNLGPRIPFPANDEFSNATTVSGNIVYATGHNNGATLASGEPDSIGQGGSSVWYQWTAPATGTYAITTFGSNFDSLLYVFTGNDILSLTEVGANDDAPAPFGTLQSRVLVNATASTSYKIAIHGDTGDTGNVTLQISNAGPYATWLARYPALTGANALRTANPDGDPYDNLLELALGLDPTVNSGPLGPDPAGATRPVRVVTPTTIGIQFTRAYGNLNAGVGLPIELLGRSSTNLVDWSTTIIPVSFGGNLYRVEITITPGLRQFLLLSAEDPN